MPPLGLGLPIMMKGSTSGIRLATESIPVGPPVGGLTIRGWWDASDSTSIVLSGSDVESWAAQAVPHNPLIDNGNSKFSKFSDPSRPRVVAAGQNGLDYIRCDAGQAERLRMTASSNRYFEGPDTEESILFLTRRFAFTHSVDFYNNGQTRRGGFKSSERPVMQGTAQVTNPNGAGTAWGAIAYCYKGSGVAGSKVIHNRNSTTGTWVKSGTDVTDSQIDLNASGKNQDFAEIIIVEGVITDVNWGLLIDWWNSKWGLAL